MESPQNVDEFDSAFEIKPLPNFIPTELQYVSNSVEKPVLESAPVVDDAAMSDLAHGELQIVAESENQIKVVSIESESIGGESVSADGGVVIDPVPRNDKVHDADESGVERELKMEPAGVIESTFREDEFVPEMVTIDKATFDLLMGLANKVNAKNTLIDPSELQRVNETVSSGGAVLPGLNAISGQQQIKNGAQAIIEGGASVLGATASLAGVIAERVGRAVAGVSEALNAREVRSSTLSMVSNEVAVLPRISEYRIEQAEKAASAYDVAINSLWQSGSLPDVRKEIEERARVTGLSVADVMEKMKPHGEMVDLYDKFKAAVVESPEALNQKKALDKALDGWIRQNGRGREELLNPETEGNPYFEELKSRLDKSQRKMESNVSLIPQFDDEKASHAEKLREALQKIVERLKEIAKDFLDIVRGKRGEESDNAPSP